METRESHDISLKELPTKEQKLKRNKDRRETPAVVPLRLRLKSSTSPPYESDLERSMSDRSISSSPDSVNLNHSPAFPLYYKCSQEIDHLHISPNMMTEISNDVFFENSVCRYTDENPFTDSDTDYDQPLDMSTKRSSETAKPSEAYNFNQQQRPSVITCASALLRTQCTLKDLSHHACSTIASANSDETEKQGAVQHAVLNKETGSNNCEDSENIHLGHYQDIVSGSCDPVIDEHFRRSLGKDYQQIVSKSSANSVSITVDDHFAKALGDTWLQLQQSKSTATESSIKESKTKLHSQKPSQFLQHSPEIISSS